MSPDTAQTALSALNRNGQVQPLNKAKRHLLSDISAVDNCRGKNHYNPVRVKHMPTQTALVIVGLFGLLALRPVLSQELPPNEIAERVQYSEIICSATIVNIFPTRNVVKLQGEERRQWIAVATIDHMFKGTLDPKIVEFKYYGNIPPPGISDISTPLMANFRPGIRYLLFLKRRNQDMEVAIAPYQMEIQLAPQQPTFDASNSAPDLVLAKELVFAIQSAPDTLGRSATHYSDWTEELIGKQTISLVEPFLSSSDPLVRYQAAWWLSFREVNTLVINELNNAMQDETIEEWARSGATDRLRDMSAGR